MIQVKIKNTITDRVFTYEITEELTRLGRGDQCEIQVHSPFISRSHLQFKVAEGGVEVTDLGSSNGFRVNGVPRHQVVVRENDLLSVGDHDLVFRIDRGSGGAGPLAAAGKDFEQNRRVLFQERAQKWVELFLDTQGGAEEKLSALFPLMRESLGNERFFVFSLTPENSLKILIAFENDLPMAREQHQRIPIDTLKHALLAKKMLFVNNSAVDAEARKDLAFGSYGIKSCFIFPFEYHGLDLLLYVDSFNRLGKFFAEHRILFEALVQIYKMFLQFRVIQKSLKEAEGMCEYLQRYLSVNIKSDVMNEFKKTKIGGQTKLVTVLFTDIRGFTKLSEKQPAETVVRMLNTYFSAMTEILYRYGGTLDKFMGDAIMAHWGAFVPMDDQVNLALQTAIEMQDYLKRVLQPQWQMENLPIFSIGIGIHTDHVISGNIGSEKRMEFTVIGDGVNLASRIQGLTGKGEIIISERTYLRAKSSLKSVKRPPCKVKGKQEEIITYLVTHAPEDGALAQPVATVVEKAANPLDGLT